MIDIVLQRIRDASVLAQRLGPYLLLEILLPGGTLFALLLFVCRRARQAAADGSASPLAPATAALKVAARAVLDRLPFCDLLALADHRPGDDGLEPLGMAPA
jgi:hypothetical protein